MESVLHDCILDDPSYSAPLLTSVPCSIWIPQCRFYTSFDLSAITWIWCFQSLLRARQFWLLVDSLSDGDCQFGVEWASVQRLTLFDAMLLVCIPIYVYAMRGVFSSVTILIRWYFVKHLGSLLKFFLFALENLVCFDECFEVRRFLNDFTVDRISFLLWIDQFLVKFVLHKKKARTVQNPLRLPTARIRRDELEEFD